MEFFNSPYYTQVPNDILDNIGEFGLAEARVIFAVCRETAGWQRETVALSTSRLQELTGLTRRNVIVGVRAALERRVIKRTISGNSYVYRLRNKPEDADDDAFASIAKEPADSTAREPLAAPASIAKEPFFASASIAGEPAGSIAGEPFVAENFGSLQESFGVEAGALKKETIKKQLPKEKSARVFSPTEEHPKGKYEGDSSPEPETVGGWRKLGMRRERVEAFEYVAQAKALGMTPFDLNALADAYVEISAWQMAIEAGEERLYNRAKDTCLVLARMGYKTADALHDLHEHWQERYPSYGVPKGNQLISFASELAAGRASGQKGKGRGNGTGNGSNGANDNVGDVATAAALEWLAQQSADGLP